MRIYLQLIDLDVWLFVENGVIDGDVDAQAKEETLRGFSMTYIEKLIYCDTAQEIWNELHSIHHTRIQVACDVKGLSLEDGVVKYSKSIKDHESKDDSLISRGQVIDQHTKVLEDIQSASKLMFYCSCRKKFHLSSSCSISSTTEIESFLSSCNEEGTTLIAIAYLNIVQVENGCTSKREQDRTSHVPGEEFLESR